jgi:methylmalonyl-CoA mutase
MLAPEFSLEGDFPPAGYDEWRSLAEADLLGASFEQKLITHTYEGIDIQPLYTRRDRPGETDPNGFPGLPPFVRGTRPLGAVQTGWDLRQEHAHPDLHATNQAIQKGWVADQIDSAFAPRARNLARRKEGISGVSEFPNVGEPPVVRAAPDRIVLRAAAIHRPWYPRSHRS